ncbi:hypothetical protein BCD91_001790 [Clostridium beijerinckii]|nr:hypothetical protein [Clostridium beijerinckii]
MLKTLNHIKIDIDGEVDVIFLAGPKVNIKLND